MAVFYQIFFEAVLSLSESSCEFERGIVEPIAFPEAHTAAEISDIFYIYALFGAE